MAVFYRAQRRPSAANNLGRRWSSFGPDLTTPNIASHALTGLPFDKHDVGTARPSLLKLIPDYTVEFIWIMAKYKACLRESGQSLIGTPSMKAHIKHHWQRVQELVASL